MPSALHEALTEMFRHRPSLAAELLTDTLALPLPAYQQARLEPADLTDFVPTEYRADAVVTLTAGAGTVLAVVVETQLGRDPTKRFSWPVYLATLRARLRCPAVLLVICIDPAVARWCAAPIPLGHPGWSLVPLVLGPDRVPVVTDADHAERDPELAVLSALTHGATPQGLKVLDALHCALATVESERATLYSDVVLAALPTAAKRCLEALMATRTYEYKSDFARRYYSQGGAKMLFVVLEARQLAIPDEDRARVEACHDPALVTTWVRRAATATTVEEIFAE